MDVGPYRENGGPAPVEAGGVAPLPSMLEAYRTRVRGERRLRYLAFAGVGLGVMWLAAALLSYLDLAFAGVVAICLGATVALPCLALIVENAQRPSIAGTAEILDKRLDDRQRLVTSVELTSGGEPLGEMAQAQVSSSAALLGSIDAQELYPARVPWPAFSFSAGLLLVAFGLFLLKGALGGFTPLQAGGLPPDQKGTAALASPTAQSGLPASERTPASSSMPGGTMSGGSTDPSDAERKAEASQQAESGLQRLTKALDEQSVTQQAADNLRQGDYVGASQKLSELGQQNDQLSEAAKQGLGDSLDRAARDSGSTPDLQQAEKKASDALKGGDYRSIAKSLKDLGDAAQKTAGNVISQQELAKSFPQQPDSSQGSASQQGQQGQQQVGSQQGSQQGQQGQNGQQSQGQQQGNQGGNSGQQGQQGQPNGQGSSGSSSQAGDPNGNKDTGTGGDGHSSRVMGPADNRQLNVGNNPFELDGQPKPGDTQPADPNQNKQPGLTLEGNAGTGSPIAPSSGGPANAQGESNRLPVERWQIIQKYFGGGN